MLNDFRHHIKTSDLVSQIPKLQQVSRGTDTAFDQTTGRWKPTLEKSGGQLALGHMPPVRILQMDEIFKMRLFHASTFLGLHAKSQGYVLKSRPAAVFNTEFAKAAKDAGTDVAEFVRPGFPVAPVV